MKICIIASGDYFSTYGGGQVYVKNLVAGLQKRGHNIYVVSLSFTDTGTLVTKELIDVDNIKVWQIRLSDDNTDIDKPLELQDIVLETLHNILFDISPDVVHANGWKYATSKVCKDINISCVVTAHHGGIICPNGMLMNQNDSICNVPASMENCLKCALHFVPGGNFWSLIVQNLPKPFVLSFAKSLKSMKNIPYVSPAFQTPLGINYKLQQIEVLQSAPDCVVAPSKAIASSLLKNGVPESKIDVIPHGITPLEKKPLESELTNRPLRFGYVGRIAYIKGLHILIDALKLLPDDTHYELHIYGDGASKSEKKYRDMLKEKSKELSVIWHGKVEYDKIDQTYASFDMMILPSICLEVFGLTVLESLSSGRPVISTRCGGPEDLIKNGVDGILVKPNDVQDLANSLNKCIDEPKYVQKLSSNISEVNTLENHILDLEYIYVDILKGKK